MATRTGPHIEESTLSAKRRRSTHWNAALTVMPVRANGRSKRRRERRSARNAPAGRFARPRLGLAPLPEDVRRRSRRPAPLRRRETERACVARARSSTVRAISCLAANTTSARVFGKRGASGSASSGSSRSSASSCSRSDPYEAYRTSSDAARPGLPWSGKSAVRHGAAVKAALRASASTVSWAIFRYVVHLPPVIVTTPLFATSMKCSRESFAVVTGLSAYERPQTRKRGERVRARDRPFEVRIEFANDEIDFFAGRRYVEFGRCDRDIRRSDDDVPLPRNRKEDASVARFRHEQRIVPDERHLSERRDGCRGYARERDGRPDYRAYEVRRRRCRLRLTTAFARTSYSRPVSSSRTTAPAARSPAYIKRNIRA